MSSKMQGWQSKLLAKVGNMILIKSTLSTLSSYAMPSFILPKHVTQKMNSLCANFWWGDTPEKRRIHFKCWSDLCRKKIDGGLGFRELEKFNTALVGKLAWQMWKDEDRIWVRLLKEKYCNKLEFQRLEAKGGDSWFWKGLINSRKLIEDSAIKVVGNGEDIDIWQDPWGFQTLKIANQNLLMTY